MIPQAIKTAIDNWVLNGEAPGGFVNAILKNDLLGAIKSGDPESINSLKDIVDYLISGVPADCWGDKNKIVQWAASGGQKGIAEARQRITRINLG